MIVVSVASYDKRLSYLQKTISSILDQSLKYDKLIINIPDDSSEEVKAGFVSLKLFDSRVDVHLREAKWRSANKLLWTAREYPDAVIITCDDDIFYPKWFFEEQYEVWKKNPECIVSQETSPVFIQGDQLMHISSVDVKMRQKCFGRYLTGCCLFPPHALDDERAYDFQKFFNITHATHDELWFWCITTLRGIKTIGLDLTYSFDGDEVVLPRDENSLSRINTDLYLRDYNQKINQEFGKELVQILKSQVVEFTLTPSSLPSFCCQIQQIHQTYGVCYKIKLSCNKILKSHLKFLNNYMRKFEWKNGVEIKLND